MLQLHRAVPLRGGGALVCGGLVSWSQACLAERVGLVSARSTPAGTMSVPRVHHSAVELVDGRVLVTRGRSSSEAAPMGLSTLAELWEPAPQSFRRLGTPMRMGRVWLLDGETASPQQPIPRCLAACGGTTPMPSASPPPDSLELFSGQGLGGASTAAME